MNAFPARKEGFSLVEVALALGICAFCMVTLLGMIPTSINTDRATVEQTASAGIAASVLADLRAADNSTPAAATSSQFGIPIPSSGSGSTNHTLFFNESGTAISTVDQDATSSKNPRYRARIEFTPPATTVQKSATTARVWVTWPAVDLSAATIPTKYSGSYEVMTSLNRN